MSIISRPRTANRPEVGQLILVHGLPEQPLADLMSSGALRTVLLEGHRYIIRTELEAYSPTDIEDMIDLDAVVEINEHTAPDRLRTAVLDQADTDAYIAPSRARLIQRVNEALDNRMAANPFANGLAWTAIWATAGHVAVNMAGDLEAASMAKAYQNLVSVSREGSLDTDAFAAFHRTLLSLAAPELDDRFSEIWQPGYGLLTLPNDPEAQATVLAILFRLVALFSGYRGSPEGSDTPSKVMGDYLALVQARKPG